MTSPCDRALGLRLARGGSLLPRLFGNRRGSLGRTALGLLLGFTAQTFFLGGALALGFLAAFFFRFTADAVFFLPLA